MKKIIPKHNSLSLLYRDQKGAIVLEANLSNIAPLFYRCASYALNSLDSNTGASFKSSGFSQNDTRSCVLPGLLSPFKPL